MDGARAEAGLAGAAVREAQQRVTAAEAASAELAAAAEAARAEAAAAAVAQQGSEQRLAAVQAELAEVGGAADAGGLGQPGRGRLLAAICTAGF